MPPIEIGREMRNSVGQVEIAAIFEEFDPLRLSAVHRLGLGESSRLIPQSLIRQDGGALPGLRARRSCEVWNREPQAICGRMLPAVRCILGLPQWSNRCGC